MLEAHSVVRLLLVDVIAGRVTTLRDIGPLQILLSEHPLLHLRRLMCD